MARWLVLGAPLLLGLMLSAHSLSNRDIWLHNRAGRDFLAGGGIPVTNRYSFTEPEHTWTDHEWLFQTVIALTDRLAPAQPEGLPPTAEPQVAHWHGLRLVLTALLLLLLLREAAGKGRSCSLTAYLGIPLLGGLHLLWPRLLLRPELLSLIFFFLLVREIERALGYGATDSSPTVVRAGDLSRPAQLLNPFQPAGRAFFLVLAWAQFHGFAALGPALWLLAALAAPVQRRLPGLRPERVAGGRKGSALGPADLVLVLLFSLLALLLTPNGLSGLTYPLRALAQFSEPGVQLNRLISELVPLFQSPQSLAGTQLVFGLSLAWGLVWLIVSWGRISLLRILLWALAGGATIAAQRNIGFYALTFMMLHTGAAGSGASWWWSGRLSPKLRAPACCLLAAATALLAAFWGWAIATDDFYLREGVARRFGGGLTPAQFPVEFVPLVSDAGRARLFTNVDGAGFLIDKTRAKVFIDGRTEAYSPSLWQAYTELRAAGPRAEDLLQEYEVELVALTLGTGAFRELARRLLNAQDWDLAAIGEGSLLFKPAPPAMPAVPVAERMTPRLLELETQLLGAKDSTSPVRLADRCVALAMLWELAGQTDRQEQLLRWGLKFSPRHPLLTHNLGTILMDRGDFLAALPLFQRAAAKNRRADASLLNAGVCQFRLGRLPEAAASFAKACRINPRRLDALLNLATTRLQLNDRQGARQALQRALELHPDHPGLRQQLERLDAASGP